MKSHEIRALVDMFFHVVRTSSLCTSWQWSPTRAWAQGVSLVMFGFLCVFWGFKSSTTPTCARTHERKVRLLRVNDLVVETKVNKTLPVPNCCLRRFLVASEHQIKHWFMAFFQSHRKKQLLLLVCIEITKSQELGNAELSGIYPFVHLLELCCYIRTEQSGEGCCGAVADHVMISIVNQVKKSTSSSFVTTPGRQTCVQRTPSSPETT